MKLHQAVTLWLSQQHPVSAASHRRPITIMLDLIGRELPLAKITVVHLVTFAETINSYTFRRGGQDVEFAPGTRRKYIKAAITFFNWCVKKELIDKSPARLLVPPKVDRHVSRDRAMPDDDLLIMLEYTRNMPQENALICLVAESGCRAGGAANLRIGDIHWHEEENQSFAYTVEKGGARVKIRIGKSAKYTLQRWLLRRPVCDHDYVFTTNLCHPMTANYMGQMMRRLCAKIKRIWGYNITRGNLHSLRHRLAYKEWDAGSPVGYIATLLNHKSEMTTIISYAPTDHESAWERAGRHDLDIAPLPGEETIIQFPKDRTST